MKKIVMLMAAAVAALGISSCSKEIEDNTPTQEETKELILDVTVANLDGSVDTRAVKKGWEVGDKVNIWFDGHTTAKPDLIIKWDGTNWCQHSVAADVSGNAPSTTGVIKYCYEGFNDLSKYTNPSNNGKSGLPSIANLLYCNYFDQQPSYTYSEGVLSFEITYWRPWFTYQIVIEGIDPNDYALKCNQLSAIEGITIYSTHIACNNTRQNGYYTNGVANEDGAAFYFYMYGVSAGAKTDFDFTLMNKKNGSTYYYSVKDKYYNSPGTVTAAKIDFSKFTLDEDHSSEVNIPDPAFRAYCIENFDTNHDLKFSEAEAAVVATIDVTGLGIESLEGLQHFTSLRDLNCSNNMLTSLDVSNNLQLKWFECIGTEDYKLSSLDLTKNTNLTYLRLNNNNLTDLDVTKNTRLDYLDLSGNPLSSSIDLSQNVWLTTLSLYNCSLPYIDLSKTIRLNHIDLRRNKLTTLDISHIGLGDTWRNERIEQFWCEDNPDLKEIIARRLQSGYWTKDSGVTITRIDI